MDIVYSFFAETLKILALIYTATFAVGLLQDVFSPEKIRDYIKGKSVWVGYMAAIGMGIFTPFCSCSSIPVFLGFLSAGIPFGISAAFLISSPLISETALILLPSVPHHGGWLTVVYILSGTLTALSGGYLADRFKLESNIIFKFPERKPISRKQQAEAAKIGERVLSANLFAYSTLKSIFPYVLISLAAGFAFQQYFSTRPIMQLYLQGQKWWEVPAAVVLGIPFYANHGALMPFIDSILEQGVAPGTGMALLMSATAISLPEMILLKKIINLKLLVLFVLWLILFFVLTGYLLNIL